MINTEKTEIQIDLVKLDHKIDRVRLDHAKDMFKNTMFDVGIMCLILAVLCGGATRNILLVVGIAVAMILPHACIHLIEKHAAWEWKKIKEKIDRGESCDD